MKKLTIATRGSKLALWQAEHVKALLEKEYPGIEVELLKIKTTGDKILDVPLAKVGGKGLFVKEIEEALLDGRADLAVHSMKDVPVELPEGLMLGIIPEREDFTDTLLSVNFNGLAELPKGAKVGTSSLRRKSQLLLLRPDLDIQDLRGNVDTRLRKLNEGQFDAIVMATAGLKRLGLSAPKHQILGPPQFLPAVAQGALGIEYHKDREDVAKALAFLDHPESRISVMAERGFLTGLEGGCQVPIAAHASLNGDTVTLTGFVADLEASHIVHRQTKGPASKAFDLGLALAQEVLDAGGKAILDEVYGQNEA
ncbi:MAG: hydroxymethylbilane synthase [Thermodesulfobacteriota bacterium]|nr:hydroxymethylbilane synthase [Thermodesulfobacteriota bacterium]